MKKWRICSLAVITILSTRFEGKAQELQLLRTTHLSNYPSASTLEYFNNRLYVIGDDAPQIMVLDENHKKLEEVRMFPNREKRIRKEDKADFESSLLVSRGNKNYLVGISSFSDKKRNKVLVLNLSEGDTANGIRIITDKLGKIRGTEINIEGATLIGDKLVLGNRASLGNPVNHLVVTEFSLKKGIDAEDTRLVKVLLPESKEVRGISDFTYVKEKDLLLLTFSTEFTNNAKDDGAIGQSYIGYISQFSQKMRGDSIALDKLTPLSRLLGKSGPQKIEAVTVEEIRGNNLILHLASDNDNGASTLFKINYRL